MSEFFSAARKSKAFVSLRVLTESGWLSGSFLIAVNRRLVDTLNAGGDTIVLTNAFVPGGDTDLPFLGVRRDKMILVMPDEVETPSQHSGMFVATTARSVVMLAGLASVSGVVDVPQNLRVSDYFARNRGFINVRECRLTVRNPHGGEQWTRDLDQLLVRGDALVAVSEAEG